MTHQEFGGHWTDKKLDCLRRYLQGYMRIMKGNEKARYFKTNYVDAFAGTGYIEIRSTEDSASELLPGFELDQNRESLKKGSPCLALEIEPPFDNYIFIERNPENVVELSKLKSEFPDRNIEIIEGDANDYLSSWCDQTDWAKNRAVVFLDPFGMQVEWPLLEKLASTKSIDLWLLVPLGLGLVRLLTKKALPSSAWGERITCFLGTDEWKEAFYTKSMTPTLFGEEEKLTRNNDLVKIGDFILERLKTIFFRVSPKPLILENSKNNPMYLLVFAVGNEKGSVPAMRIANYLINNINECSNGA